MDFWTEFQLFCPDPCPGLGMLDELSRLSLLTRPQGEVWLTTKELDCWHTQVVTRHEMITQARLRECRGENRGHTGWTNACSLAKEIFLSPMQFPTFRKVSNCL